MAAFDILESEPERIERLWANTEYFQAQLQAAGFDIGGKLTPKSETPITPVFVGAEGSLGDGRKTMEYSRALFDKGVMATGIAFPTVPEGKARVRCIIDQALETMTSVAKGMGLL
jgi:glycine C-acetyltransferase